MSKNSGYESVAFAPDGSLIVGGYARRESSTVPTYKSGKFHIFSNFTSNDNLFLYKSINRGLIKDNTLT